MAKKIVYFIYQDEQSKTHTIYLNKDHIVSIEMSKDQKEEWTVTLQVTTGVKYQNKYNSYDGAKIIVNDISNCITE